MGGEVAGDYAAEIVMDKAARLQFDFSGNGSRQLFHLVKLADRAIHDEMEKNSKLEGMGSTLTLALFRQGILHWAHVGDSRLYIMRNEQLIQITKDQNMAQFLLEEGKITAKEALDHPSRNFLLQCVGCGSCEPETGKLESEAGNLIILMTDGLHGLVTGETIFSILSKPVGIQTKANFLIKAALDAGGKDNVTIVLAEI